MLREALVLLFSATIGSSFAADPAATPSPLASPIAPLTPGEPAPTVTPTSSGVAPLTVQEQSRIRLAFVAAQAAEERALLHRQEIERKEFVRLEDKQRRDFVTQQQAEFTKYFSSTRDPRARREFQMTQERAKKNWDLASQERFKTRALEWTQQLNENRSRQQEHRRLMEQALSAGKKPEPHLWPPRGL